MFTAQAANLFLFTYTRFTVKIATINTTATTATIDSSSFFTHFELALSELAT